jgi:AcrR family transcriptional regulator
MNQRGAASLDLKALGNTVGLSRNSLYYYFNDRQDLVYRCYLQAAEDLEEDIERSLMLTGGNRSQLEHLLSTILIKRTHETAVLSDLGLLDRDQRSEVQKVQARNLDRLEEIFRSGISAGDLRPNNPEIASRVLLGVINWARLWFRWTGHYRSGTSRYLAKVADDIIDGILYGISASRFRRL